MTSTSVPVVERVVEKHEVTWVREHYEERNGHPVCITGYYAFIVPPQGEVPKVDMQRFLVFREAGKKFARLIEPEDVSDGNLWPSH